MSFFSSLFFFSAENHPSTSLGVARGTMDTATSAARDWSVLFLFVEEKMVGKVGGRVVGGICLIRETFTFENVEDFERDAT